MVPESPAELIGEFLPSYLEGLLAQSPAPGGAASPRANAPSPRAGAPSPRAGAPSAARRPPASAGVGLRVVGAGEWTLRIVGGRPLVTPQIEPDVALQVSLAARDFVPLVVAPVRRALAQQAPGSGPSSGSLWARLGRWDEETVELLRQQTGGILLRIEDGELKRCVALTPSVIPYSLEHAQCTIDCALADLEQLQAKRGNPLDLFYAGQIRISGDAQIALAMAGLFL
jgi:hypothetical protein